MGALGGRRPRSVPRVLVVGQGPPTKGGIPTFVTELMSNSWLAERVHLDFLNTTPVEAKHPGALSFANARLALTHASAIFRRARHGDIVHLNLAPAPELPLLRALFLAAAGRAAGARVILHAHSGRIENCLRPAYRMLLRLASRLVDEFVVVSRSAEGAVRSLGNRATYLANGIDVELFSTGPKSTDPPVLTFVGTVCERKGLIDLLEALRSILSGTPGSRAPVHVLVIGDSRQEGPEAFRRVRRAYVEAGLEEVEFCGAVDRDRIVELLGRSSIFCLPSHWEGLPLSVLEAMASEAAVVATSVGEIPSMLDHGRAGVLVAPHDSVALGRAIERLLRDPEERARLGRAARARASEQYGQDRMVARLNEIYGRLADHSM